MPHQVVTTTAFARNLSDFLNQVRYQGVSLDVKRGNEIVACVCPAETRPGYPLGELDRLFAALPHLTADEMTAWQNDIADSIDRLATDADPWAI